MTGLVRGFRVAVLTGTDSIATVEAIRSIHAVPGVDVVAILQDRGVFPWQVRLRRALAGRLARGRRGPMCDSGQHPRAGVQSHCFWIDGREGPIRHISRRAAVAV